VRADHAHVSVIIWRLRLSANELIINANEAFAAAHCGCGDWLIYVNVDGTGLWVTVSVCVCVGGALCVCLCVCWWCICVQACCTLVDNRDRPALPRCHWVRGRGRRRLPGPGFRFSVTGRHERCCDGNRRVRLSGHFVHGGPGDSVFGVRDALRGHRDPASATAL